MKVDLNIAFYREERFKETPIGKIPEDWEIFRLGNIIRDILTGATPLRSKRDYWENGTIPWLTNTEVKEGIINYIYDTIEKVTQKALKETNVKLIPPNSVILSLTASVGKVAINRVPITTNQQFNSLILKDNVLPEFLAYYLIFSKRRIEQLGGLTTFKFISKETIKKLTIALPSSQEQKAIVYILSTVDKAIQKTNEIIKKIKRLKKGLMQELLTKGIGHKEFKNTEIGRIPKEWRVVKLKEIILEAKPGFACGKRDKNGVIQLRMDSIDIEGWINPKAYVKVPPPKNVKDYFLKPGDILFNNTNSIDLIGKTAIFRREFSECVYSNHLTRIRVNPAKVIPEWILYVFIRKWQLRIFRTICHPHVHQAGINKSDLLNLKIPLPSLYEQNKIVGVILTIDKELKVEIKRKKKLERIKKALMDLLLTGKIRVRVN